MTNQLKLQQLIKLLDLTRLSDNDHAGAMDEWLQQQADAPFSPAAFCVYPQFLGQTRLFIQQQVWPSKLATVVNFPSGDLAADLVVAEVQAALAQGADEIDCVLPYRTLLAGHCAQVKDFLVLVRQSCRDQCLKVIIESGELSTPQQICKATELVIDSGADFVKSSTGKVPIGITNEAARIMLTVIAAAGRPVGFKASGGVRTVAQALELVRMYEEITGQLAKPELMRIGASTLFGEINQLLAATKA
ncbi:deoxyribose-phosphate aldolase [Rheinheimera sp. SA_1]|uniref:deoxyribose-phosphate aldolase n=1 Tax=Rheinheimera sp. SA_1 TaxID=1827365 RepID=UPI0007FBAF47|nr:deoxyribose-phosphate aldolase [Rheinheimera sp. SA_1]OBP15215.1 deoxyribose-phosphate aldolase [Rheinheimera sp. SA_1]